MNELKKMCWATVRAMYGVYSVVKTSSDVHWSPSVALSNTKLHAPVLTCCTLPLISGSCLSLSRSNMLVLKLHHHPWMCLHSWVNTHDTLCYTTLWFQSFKLLVQFMWIQLLARNCGLHFLLCKYCELFPGKCLSVCLWLGLGHDSLTIVSKIMRY